MESGSLSSLDNLTHLGFRDGVDMRPTLIRVLTDLYVQKLAHSYEEKRHYTELALRLLNSVDAATRLAVATRLARHLSPPVRVMVRLASDLPEIAALARTHPVLQPKQEKKPARRRSRRRKGSADDKGSAGDASSARDTNSTGGTCCARGATSAAGSANSPGGERTGPGQPAASPAPVAPPLPPKRERPERPAAATWSTITADVASELNEQFFAASADERRLILLNLHIAVPMPAGRVGLSKEAIVIKRLETAALAHNREDFAAYLAQAIRVARMQARRITADDLGEPIVAGGEGAQHAARRTLSRAAVRQSDHRPFGRARACARRFVRRDDGAGGRTPGHNLAGAAQFRTRGLAAAAVDEGRGSARTRANRDRNSAPRAGAATKRRTPRRVVIY